jgi:O-acetyl-ADP-ribose deacetylase (regulator of RNase III)
VKRIRVRNPPLAHKPGKTRRRSSSVSSPLARVTLSGVYAVVAAGREAQPPLGWRAQHRVGLGRLVAEREQAKITRGYHLPARYVLHTVGPVVQGGPHARDAQALASSYRACLDLAAEVETIRNLAFCAVSTGVFGYPKEAAAPLALHTVSEWLTAHPGRFDRVVFTVFEDDDELAYRHALGAGARP